jgi:hypothetical protein
MRVLRDWMESDPDPTLTGARYGCLIALGVYFLGCGALLVLIWWLL